MKMIMLGIAATFLFLTANRAAPNDQTFTGDIMDGHCAELGSHAEMLKDHQNLNTAKECTLACIKNGDKFVLFNAITKTTYQLDDQNKPVQFAGSSVVVSGTADDSTKTIHVSSIVLSPKPDAGSTRPE